MQFEILQIALSAKACSNEKLQIVPDAVTHKKLKLHLALFAEFRTGFNTGQIISRGTTANKNNK